MRYRILLTACAVLSFLFDSAQKSSKAFVITSSEGTKGQWMDVRLVDMNTGAIMQSVFSSNKSTWNVYNARSGNEMTVKDARGMVKDASNTPFFSNSAACAYDAKHNRLYYTPMYVNQLRYIDLNASSPKIYYFEGEKFSGAADLNNMANHITRMVIAADGNGYAISNDGNHFVQFTTGRKPVITDLGALTDDPSNGQLSIHGQKTSWGGDMIADAFGNLYVISAYHNVFKIDIQSRTAKFVSEIKGLPANFTTNGAAIDEEGRLLVSSAQGTGSAYYEVDLRDWQAKKLELQGKALDASDMASGNLAFESKNPVALISRDIVRNDKIAVFPNPVPERTFKVTFNNRETGRYSIQVVDLLGRIITKKEVLIAGEGQVVEMNVSKQIAGGTYLIKVLSNTAKAVYSDKIIIQ